MTTKARPIPAGYHTVTPHIVIRDAANAIEFYKNAFGAKELGRMPGPGGKLMHAEIQIGDSRIMIADEFPEFARSPQSLGGTSTTLYLYVEDVDEAFKRAVDAGGKPTMPPMDAFWGDRYGKLTDPFGHEWSLATHKQDLTPEQIQKGAEAFFAQMGKQ